MVRCGVYGARPQWMLADVESDSFPWPPADVYFNVGIMYHLADPVAHLKKCIAASEEAILLDTHFTVNSRGEPFHGLQVKVHGEKEAPKSGLHGISRWMRLEDIVRILKDWFREVEVVNKRVERNGPRATILAIDKKGHWNAR